jgi:hypothetical protein
MDDQPIASYPPIESYPAEPKDEIPYRAQTVNEERKEFDPHNYLRVKISPEIWGLLLEAVIGLADYQLPTAQSYCVFCHWEVIHRSSCPVVYAQQLRDAVRREQR